MELKGTQDGSPREEGEGESIQWNWKGALTVDIAGAGYYESIQWNWKPNLPLRACSHPSHVNPFNGIERYRLPDCEEASSFDKNPFNGIERKEELEEILGLMNELNPFNGIESIRIRG